MDQFYYTSKRKAGQHLRLIDRQRIEWEIRKNHSRSKKDKKSQREIAMKIGISPPTLSRELKRGKVKLLDSHLRVYTSYSSVVAQFQYVENSSAKGPNLKIGKDHKLCKIIESMLLGEGKDSSKTMPYSPDAIVMHFDKKGWPTGKRLSTKTIYNYIKQDVFAGVTQKDLPRKGKVKKRSYRHLQRLSHKRAEYRLIDERPIEASERLEPGHWEMDCIESTKGDNTCLLTMVDRCTRDVYIFKLQKQSQEAVKKVLDSLEYKYGSCKFRQRFKTFTVDNGAEFIDWESLEKSVYTKQSRTRIYYAHPYSSWERGSNENCNGFIRYFIPKGSRLKDLSRRWIKELQACINDYPRRILGGMSSNEYSSLWELAS